MTSRAATCLAAIASLAFAAAAAPHYVTYVNDRFGTTAEVPADWTPGEPPANNDGLRFTSPDQRAWMTVYGRLHIDDTVEEAIKDFETPGKDETITYRHRERRAVVSGTRGDTILFSKHVLSCRDQIWNNVHIEYPAADKTAYDALVTRMARSLRGGPSWQVRGCK